MKNTSDPHRVFDAIYRRGGLLKQQTGRGLKVKGYQAGLLDAVSYELYALLTARCEQARRLHQPSYMSVSFKLNEPIASAEYMCFSTSNRTTVAADGASAG